MKTWLVGWLLLVGTLLVVSGASLPEGDAAAPALPATAVPAEAVQNALDSLAVARRALVTGAYLGRADHMARAAATRDRALDTLEQAMTHPGVIRELPWPVREAWLGFALSERLPHWSRALLEGLHGELPPTGSPSRGPVSLAVALNALRLLESNPEDENAFLRGAEHAALERVAGGALEAAAAESFPLRDEALYRLWQLADANGETQEAAAWADLLARDHARSPRTPWVRVTRARALLDRGRAADAVEEARLAYPQADNAQTSWFIAEALVALDFRREAARELERLVGKFGEDRLARRALELREQMGREDASLALTLSDLVRLKQSLLPQPGSGAVAWFRAVADSVGPSTAVKDDAALRLCRYLYRVKRYAEAEPYLVRLTRSRETKIADEARLILARIYRNTGRIADMEPHYTKLAEASGGGAARALWELGREYQDLMWWGAADSTFTSLVERFPRDSHYRDGVFRRGFVRVRLGRREAAVEDFRAALVAARTDADEERAAFWLARTLRELGRENEAREAARVGAANREPSDYYGILLRERFAFTATPPPAPPNCPLDPGNPLALFAGDDAWPAPVAEHYLRGLALAELGQHEAARTEWTRAASLGKRVGPVMQALALAAAAHYMYPEGITWANRAAALLPGRHEARDGFRRLAFPPAYYGELTGAARREGVSPSTLWALMRQESLYDPLAVSRAGAMGLMQIMPATLSRITAEAGLPGVPTDALFQPRVNITLGTRFFADRSAEFGGRLLPTLASYNAGEGKAWKWLERAGGDSAEFFVESIGYPETQGYVRRIPWLIWVYESYYTRDSWSPPKAGGR